MYDFKTFAQMNLDLIFQGFDRMPQPGEEVFAKRFTMQLGGGPIVCPIVLEQLGFRVRLGTFLGQDDVSNLCRRLLDQRGFSSYDEFAQDNPDPVVVFAPVGQPEVTRRLHEEGVKVVYDSGWSDDLSIDGIKAFLPYIDVYTPNDKEARKLAGTDDLEEAVRFLAGYTPHPVVTLGKGGCAYWHDGSIRYVSAIDEFRAVDTTGAGDNFLTGIIYGLLTEEPLDRCVRLGNIFAGKSTTAVGCFGAAVTPALIRKYL